MRILELFSGIGSVSAAIGNQHKIVGAIDINEVAIQVYRANFDTPVQAQEIASLTLKQLDELAADCWWLSPPCQPFTRRGKRNDTQDPRSAALLHLLTLLPTLRPTFLALENVVGFEQSETYQRLLEVLADSDYQFAQLKLCPSEFGIPNLRPRFFLVASQNGLPELTKPTEDRSPQPVSAFLQLPNQLEEDLGVSEAGLEKYYHAIHVAEPNSTFTRCFTSAYGKSNVRSGSYLKTADGYRRFSPREIARLIGFPDTFRLPESLSTRQKWKLLGNSVSIHCVQQVFAAFADLTFES